MVDLNSPLGRRSFATSMQSRVLSVPNEEPNSFAPPPEPEHKLLSTSEVEAVQTARRAKIMTAKRINPVAKERIEILTGLGRCQETVIFEDVSFSLQSLKSGEMREVVRISNAALNAADSYFEARLQTLARAIYQIDGQHISLVLGSDKLEDTIAWLEAMDESLIEYIHNHYLEMIRKNRSKFAIKDEQDAKEVAEEIKK